MEAVAASFQVLHWHSSGWTKTMKNKIELKGYGTRLEPDTLRINTRHINGMLTCSATYETG
jgi:hypothetical protein